MDSALRAILALAAALLGALAVFLLPGRNALEEGSSSSYGGRGKWLVFIISLAVLAVAGALLYDGYQAGRKDDWLTGAIALLCLLGLFLLVGNFLVLRNLKGGRPVADGTSLGTSDAVFPDGVPPPALSAEELAAHEEPAGREAGPDRGEALEAVVVEAEVVEVPPEREP